MTIGRMRAKTSVAQRDPGSSDLAAASREVVDGRQRRSSRCAARAPASLALGEDLNEVAAGVVEDGCGDRAHGGRRLGEAHAEAGEALVLGVDVAPESSG